MKGHRVVITGLGCVSPVGLNVNQTWSALLAGRSGIGEITSFDTNEYAVKIAGELKGFNMADWSTSKSLKRIDQFISYGMAACIEAMGHAQLSEIPDTIDRSRFGVCLGSGIGGLLTIEEQVNKCYNKGPSRVSPFYVPGAIINMLSGIVSMDLGLRGMNISPVAACTTGTHAIALAARAIAYGDADAMLAGSAEKACTPTGMAGFNASRALSRRNDEPTKASRPWDADRDGFVLSEGAGALVLESLEHAQARNAPILCEVAGAGFSGDAYHMTAPNENGTGAIQCMHHALNDAQIKPELLGYINAHGTSTPLGDQIEITAIKSVFQSHAKALKISSTKSMTGHLLGAAGAIEGIFTCLSLQDQIAPPTINLDNPSEGCDLNLVPHESQPIDTEYAMSNSFGFGGTNSSLIFKKWSA